MQIKGLLWSHFKGYFYKGLFFFLDNQESECSIPGTYVHLSVYLYISIQRKHLILLEFDQLCCYALAKR